MLRRADFHPERRFYFAREWWCAKRVFGATWSYRYGSISAGAHLGRVVSPGRGCLRRGILARGGRVEGLRASRRRRHDGVQREGASCGSAGVFVDVERDLGREDLSVVAAGTAAEGGARARRARVRGRKRGALGEKALAAGHARRLGRRSATRADGRGVRDLARAATRGDGGGGGEGRREGHVALGRSARATRARVRRRRGLEVSAGARAEATADTARVAETDGGARETLARRLPISSRARVHDNSPGGAEKCQLCAHTATRASVPRDPTRRIARDGFRIVARVDASSRDASPPRRAAPSAVPHRRC